MGGFGSGDLSDKTMSTFSEIEDKFGSERGRILSQVINNALNAIRGRGGVEQ